MGHRSQRAFYIAHSKLRIFIFIFFSRRCTAAAPFPAARSYLDLLKKPGKAHCWLVHLKSPQASRLLSEARLRHQCRRRANPSTLLTPSCLFGYETPGSEAAPSAIRWFLSPPAHTHLPSETLSFTAISSWWGLCAPPFAIPSTQLEPVYSSSQLPFPQD